MIAKIPPKRKDGKSSFKDLIDYIRGKDGNRAVYTGFQGISDFELAAVEMEVVAHINVRCKDPVFHFILSWRELEFPTNAQADEAVEIALKELDLQNCQALWALQADTENRHVHVVVNRIDPETSKAIQPAGNWTHKALERAARKIEAAQGWEVLTKGRYEVTPDGEVKERPSERQDEDKRLSQTARDIEAHTAAKSAERIGKETAAPIVRASKSWKELRVKLAEREIAFERKGSGAVLRIGETVIKASTISRDMSLSKLEARLGPYRERESAGIADEQLTSKVEASISSSGRPPEPIEKVERAPAVKSSWDRYQEVRERYFTSKKAAFSELRERQKKERVLLQKEQKDERARLFGRSWKGKGRELNQQRSFMASAQQAAKLNLRDRLEEEREWLKKQFPMRFPNFKTWLNWEANPELSVLFRCPDEPVMLGTPNAGAERKAPEDLRTFAAFIGNRGGVAYFRKDRKWAQTADFVDYGKKILLSREYDEVSVLAALQLASQKWGTVEISGPEAYRRLCVSLAIQHSIQLANADLRRDVEEGRKRLAEERNAHSRSEVDWERKKAAVEGSKNIFSQYADAIGAERFRVVVTDFSQEVARAFIFDKKTDGLEGKTREGILDSMFKFHQYEHYGKNINVTPLSPNKHHILIDDMTDESLERLKRDGYKPACVIESSPASFQAILTVPKLSGDLGHEAANRLTKELNERYGDPKLSGAVHAHRLPPFMNQKPKHRREDGTYPPSRLVAAEGGMCEKAAEQLKVTRNHLAEEAEKLRREQEHRERRAAFGDWSANATDPTGAYRTHWRDVIEKQRGDTDYSRVDAMTALRMRVTGYSAGQIYDAIRNNAPAMRKEAMNEREYSEKYRYRNWERYAKETVEKYAFGPRGAAQYNSAEEYRAYYLKLEGRSMADERRPQQDFQRAAASQKDMAR